MKKFVLVLLISCMVITGCTVQNDYTKVKVKDEYTSDEISNELEAEEGKRFENLIIQSVHIGKNEIDENIEQKIFVYLPP